jgi:hypothetical protein
VVKTTATSSSRRYRNYSYPRRLEFDAKMGHKDWLLRSIRGAHARMVGLIERALKETEGRWRS